MHSERIKQVLRGKGVEREVALMTIHVRMRKAASRTEIRKSLPRDWGIPDPEVHALAQCSCLRGLATGKADKGYGPAPRSQPTDFGRGPNRKKSISLPESFSLESMRSMNNAPATRKDAESEWLAKDNQKLPPVPYNPRLQDRGQSSSPDSIACCSPPGCPVPISLLLGQCVCLLGKFISEH